MSERELKRATVLSRVKAWRGQRPGKDRNNQQLQKEKGDISNEA